MIIKQEASIKQEPGVQADIQAEPDSTPLKVANIRSTLLNLSMTSYSRTIVQESLTYLESKVVQYRVIEPNSLGVKVLRANKPVKPRSQKLIKGPLTLDRAYIEQDNIRIAAAEVLEMEKVANREARKVAKELKAEEVKKQPKVIKVKSKGTKRIRIPGSAKIAQSRVTRHLKYDAEGADLRRLEVGVSFLSPCGMYFW